MENKGTFRRIKALPQDNSIRRLAPNEERKVSGGGVLSVVSTISFIAMIGITIYQMVRSRNSSGKIDLSNDPKNKLRAEWSDKDNQGSREDLENLAKNIREHDAFIKEFYDN